MRKGFLVTLATVAIALMGLNAMALAPTIKDIPDIIVGDAEDSSDANIFVAPDFLDVGTTTSNELVGRYVQDDDTSPGAIIWSYATEGSSRYLINGVGPQSTTLGGNLNQFVLPSNRLDDTDDDAAEADGDPRSLTIRDETLSPMAGTPPYPDPGNQGDVVGTQVVVLYASDGTTVSNPLEASGEKGMITIYSVEDAFDSFSPVVEGETVLGPLDLTAGIPTGWLSATEFGTVAITSVGGLCLETQLNVNGGGNWRSAYGDVDLVKNSVYQLRLGVTTDATVGAQPLWLVVYDNVNDAGTQGTNSYGGEMFLLDNEGGANSVIPGTGISSEDGNVVKFWMMPPCFQVSYFQDETNGFFKPALDADNDMRIILRVLDTTAAGIGAEFDEGKICFTSVQVQRFDWADVSEVAGGDILPLDTTLTNTGSEWGADQSGISSTLDWTTSAGDVIIGSSGDSWSTSAGGLLLFRPGDTTLVLTTPSTVPDNYPAQYEADTDYLVEYELSAPTENDVLNNPDVIRLGASPVTEEIVTDHFLTTNTPDSTSVALAARGVVMPRNGGPYKYAVIWNSLMLTNSALRGSGTDVDRMRPRFEILNGTPFAPLGRTTNTGKIQIHSVRVQAIEFGAGG